VQTWILRNEFLSVMTKLGIHLEPAEYEKVIAPAIDYGFGIIDEEGKLVYEVPVIREAVIDAATTVSAPNHRVVVRSLLNWLSRITIE